MGIPTSKLDADWAAQRIKNFSLVSAVKTALFGDPLKKHKHWLISLPTQLTEQVAFILK